MARSFSTLWVWTFSVLFQILLAFWSVEFQRATIALLSTKEIWQAPLMVWITKKKSGMILMPIEQGQVGQYMWIVERMRYPTNQLTEQLTDTASYRGALSHLKITCMLLVWQWKQQETWCIFFCIFQPKEQSCIACQFQTPQDNWMRFAAFNWKFALVSESHRFFNELNY